MKNWIIHAGMLAILLAASNVVSAGLTDCLTRGGDCCGEGLCYTECVPEYKTKKIKKHYYTCECEEVCIPPVTLPCCKGMFRGRFCGRDECGDCGGCGDCCGTCRNGVLQKLFGCFAACRSRTVRKLKKHDYECEKQVVEWKCVPCGTGCCGAEGCATGTYCQPQCAAPACAVPTYGAPACAAPVGDSPVYWDHISP